jgi:chemotaxis response regulator CheB
MYQAIVGTACDFQIVLVGGFLLNLTLIARKLDTCIARSPPMEKAIRVLVANRPRLMRETILAMFADQPDIEIVGEVDDDSEIIECVKRTLPNFVVIALDQPGRRPRVCDDLLREHPDVRVIAVAPAENYIVYYWVSLDIHSSNIEASEDGMLSALRSKLVARETN